VAVTFDADDPGALAPFWGSLLGRDVVPEPGGALLAGEVGQVSLRFVKGYGTRSGPNRLHLHLTSVTPEHQQQIVEQALRLGGQHRDVGQLPEEDHIVLADPGDNEFCVIGPDNKFLAGCGSLGEVSCDGSRDVGLFWRDALDWPLVWDQDEETAIQSPAGGTKLSWGGPPVAAKHGPNRQRFDLATADLPVEVARLVALGATRLADNGDRVELADPDGNEFLVTQG
jgi:hypothetical protein